MAYSNQTPNYGLPLPVGTDKSSWLDTNTAFAAVDTALKGAVDGVAALSGTTGGISEALTGLTNRVDGIDTDITILKNVDGTIVGNFGTVETGQVSAHEYSAGDMFVWLNVIRKATVAIHVGDQFVNGTNCVIVSLDDVIGNLNVINELGSISEALSVNHWTKVAEVTGDGTSTYASIFNTLAQTLAPYTSEDYDIFLDLIDNNTSSIRRFSCGRKTVSPVSFYFTNIVPFSDSISFENYDIIPNASSYKSVNINYASSTVSASDASNLVPSTLITIRVYAKRI
jgi:hypothetical protein